MKKIILLLFITLFTVSSIIAQQTEKRNLTSFDEIYVKGRVELHLIKSKKPSIEIEISDRYDMKRVVSKVQNGKLKIYYDKKYRPKKNPKIVIYLYHDGIKEMEFDGVIRFDSEDVLKEPEMVIKGDGIVRGKLEVNVKTLRVSINGISNLTISGTTDYAKLYIDGLGKINASELETEKFDKSTNGIARIRM
tara:strand:+ start:30137 stop:30712 length:576 start_codon:yes stop_codon:yes gene_type:complete